MTTSNTDVQRLLASLASYSEHDSYSPTLPSTTSNSTEQNYFTSALPGLAGIPPDAVKPTPTPPLPTYSSASTPRPSSTTPDPRLKRPFSATQSPSPAPSRPAIPDASLITTWTAAITHVMTHLLPDPTFATKIRRLITSQHAHERDWHDKRLAIVSKHAARSTSSVQLQNIFANLGVPLQPPTPQVVAASPEVEAVEQERKEAETKELQAYDAKVYKQLLALAGDFDRQLRGLGVPFYAIRHELVVLEEGREKDGGGASGAKRIDRGELRELQKRMLGWLEMSFPVD